MFWFPIVHLVIFQENQGLGVLRVWVQVTQSWLQWPVISMSKEPHSQKGPHLCSPCLEMPHISLTRGPTLLCPRLSFLTGSYKLGSWSWAPSEMLMRKERYPPSFTFLPDQIHKQILIPFLQLVSCCIPLASSSLTPLDQVTGLEPMSRVLFQ